MTIRDTGGVELIVKMLMESNHTRTRVSSRRHFYVSFIAGRENESRNQLRQQPDHLTRCVPNTYDPFGFFLQTAENGP